MAIVPGTMLMGLVWRIVVCSAVHSVSVSIVDVKPHYLCIPLRVVTIITMQFESYPII